MGEHKGLLVQIEVTSCRATSSTDVNKNYSMHESTINPSGYIGHSTKSPVNVSNCKWKAPTGFGTLAVQFHCGTMTETE